MGANRKTMKEVISGVAVGVPLVNEVTDNGVITALSLEQSVWLGLTFGAWFKIGLAVALFLLILERVTSIYRNLKGEKNGRTCTKGA